MLQAPLKQLIVGDAPSSLDATTEPPLRRQPARAANALSRMTVRVGDALASQLSRSPEFFKAWICGWVARKLCLLDDEQQRMALQDAGELFMQECR